MNFTDLATDERRARMTLSIIAEPNDSVTGSLLTRVGAVETIRLVETAGQVPGLSRVDGIMWRERLTPQISAALVADQLRNADRLGFGVLVPGDADWPAGVDDLGERAPFVLWTRGASSFLSRPRVDLVTITGARAATVYGEHVARELASNLTGNERVIVAGGAYGIEGAVHRAALASDGDTIAVLAGGVDRLYPAGHSELLSRIADVGLLVSEMPPGATPTRHRLLARNRLMASITGATVIVEAGGRSGALHTALQARLLSRGVGAVPGPVTSAASNGTHQLLQDRSAQMVTRSDDVNKLLAEWNRPTESPLAFPVSQIQKRRTEPPGL